MGFFFFIPDPGWTSSKVALSIEVQQQETSQAELFVKDGMDKNSVTLWLEIHLRAHAQSMLQQSVIVEYIGRNLDNLTEVKGIDIAVLGRCRHQLLEAMKRNLTDTQEQSRKKAMEQFLFADNANVITENVFEFGKYDYNPPQQYHGRYAFNKHYYASVAKMNEEEIEVAKILDTMEQVEFWVRSTERKGSFVLPLYNSKFYPDFIAKLTDGRILIVEHKGEHLITADEAKAKGRIGKFWASKTGNAFIMTTKDNTSAPLYTQILDVLK